MEMVRKSKPTFNYVATAGNVQSRVYMHAVEWDTVERSTTIRTSRPSMAGLRGKRLTRQRPGNEVIRILSPMQEHREYIDIDHEDDLLTGGDLVQTYHFIGDRDGGAFGGTDEPSVQHRIRGSAR